MGSRTASHRYRDPLDEIWVGAAGRIGFSIARTRDAYAATNGDGVIRVGEPELLDADDSLAQIIFHELCHALVEGETAWQRPDWGLDNTGARDEAREQACLRLQATLAGAHGLRRVLAATTEHRGFYDALPDDALGDDAAARAGLARSGRAPFAPHLDEALAATARVAREAARWAPGESLLSLVEERHPTGFALRSNETCGTCVWRSRGRCRHAAARVEAGWRACARWEGALDCQTCGACCRAAFHSVTVGRRDPVIRRHPELVVRRERYVEILRDGDHCAALEETDGRYACRIYDERPRPCREFPVAGDSCLLARRRVSLSAG